MEQSTKEQFIETLLQFEDVHYNRLYQFLSWDARVTPFSCMSSNVDCNHALESIHYPEYIHDTLCDNRIWPWNIDTQLLLDVVLGKETINRDNHYFD